MTHDGRRRAILAIDTATTRVVIATGSPDGVADGVSTWEAGYRHGETLLPDDRAVPGRAEHPPLAARRDRRRHGPRGVHGAAGGDRDGQGPGPRPGHPAGRRVDGRGAPRRVRPDRGAVLLLPAGPSDRILVRPGAAPRACCRAARTRTSADDEVLIAVDLDGRAPADAVARGEAARAGLGQALLQAAARPAARRGRGLAPDADGDPRHARPRVRHAAARRPAAAGTVAWSRDPR